MSAEPLPSRPDLATEESVDRRWWGGPGKWALVVPVLVLAFVAYTVRLPYFVIGPGPARDVEPLIHVRDARTYPSNGHFLLTSVTVHQANAFDLLTAWIDPASSVVPEREILAPGQTQEEEVQIAQSEMDTSKIDAAYVALSAHAGYPRKHRPGVLIEYTFPGTPADGKLFAGDVIVSVDGHRLAGQDDLSKRILDAGAGHPIELVVNGRPGGSTNVSVTPVFDAKANRAIIGVSTVPNFPFPLTIRSGDIGGPSAGLMWTLGLIDLLTPGDLTGGRKIAGTGVIEPNGKVDPIGEIEEKVVAAERAGAVLFFAPAENAAAARSVADGMTIVAVRTYRDAVRYLQKQP